MDKKYTAEEIAFYVINKCIDAGKPISNLQLQKTLYFIQEMLIKQESKPLFEDKFYAWQYGPVIPKIYRQYSCYVGSPISDRQETINLDGLSTSEFNLIDSVISKCQDARPWELVRKSHTSGLAWAKVYRDGEGAGDEIDPSLIAADDLTAMQA